MLKAEERNKGNLKSLREKGLLPAVFYGAKQKSTPVAIDSRQFGKIWKEAGESTTIILETPKGKVETLIHDIQFDPMTDLPIHVDFLAIEADKELEVGVPLEFTGISEAVKAGLGTLVKVLHELEIKALPRDLPHSIKVDISKLATLDDQVLVSDIVLPSGVKSVTKSTEVVAMVAPFVEEKEEVAAAPDLSQIEVAKKGKKEEEEAVEEKK
jgi:large subunit ribosomal protein L25